jgi:hypothetical protein
MVWFHSIHVRSKVVLGTRCATKIILLIVITVARGLIMEIVGRADTVFLFTTQAAVPISSMAGKVKVLSRGLQ